jgi:hypothetical protein
MRHPARGKARWGMNSDKTSQEESVAPAGDHKAQLQLTARQFKHWAGTMDPVLFNVDHGEEPAPLPPYKSEFANMDDWLPVGDMYHVTDRRFAKG